VKAHIATDLGIVLSATQCRTEGPARLDCPALPQFVSMAYTVAAACDSYYEDINLSGDHREAAIACRDNAVDTLSK
jgi:hypothetical protein